ncbi:spore germination protein GerPC [Paenibacillus sp.]|uniref:spore germination protein GerPC n=1 Tax=Paenibacillus sp. TaxID=58172 RepID=UPI002D476E2E|nr:spore germination protein GerPC [Paenibacillus sp.]HZG83958.1 spore germination protein GerPC [Paenibacillus sp.]
MDPWSVTEQIHRLYAETARLAERLQQAEEKLERMSRELNELKQRPTGVEKIEYRFDQLKIDTLQGTLHIGIRPEDASGEPIWTLGGSPAPAAGPPAAGSPAMPSMPSPFLNIQRSVRQYINETVPPTLARLCEEVDYDLEPEELDRVVGDLQSQVDARIAHYMKISTHDPGSEPERFERSVAERTIRDVEEGIRRFVAGRKPPSGQGG